MTEGNWVTDVAQGYRIKTIKVGNATIEIYRPILTDEERARAEAQVIQALSRFGKS